MKTKAAVTLTSCLWQNQSLTRRQFLRCAGVASAVVAVPRLCASAAQAPLTSDQERERVERALPASALVTPHKARKLLIFDLNVNYGGHPSIRTANQAFTRIGEKTGAFETVISRDPAVFKPESLKQFDAVFLNNNVGNLFTDAALRQSLVEFVYGGGGLMGVHGTTVAFTKWPGAIEDWPEFGVMLGARGANHRDSTELVMTKLDDPDHPLNKMWGGKGFEYRDEFFRVGHPYSRERVRVLFSIDVEKTPNEGQARGNVMRADQDYALSWVRQYGRGRVFYCTIAHNPYVFWDPKMLQFYLGAAQFVLGDLDAPTIPSAKLNAHTRASEALGWHTGLLPERGADDSLYSYIDETARMGLFFLGARYGQQRGGGGGAFDASMPAKEMEELRLQLDKAGVRLLTCSIDKWPVNAAEVRRLFIFARRMGIEALLAKEPGLEELALADALCKEHEIRLALSPKAAPQEDYKQLVNALKNRSQGIGICGNLDSWRRQGLNPAETVRLIGNRLVVMQICDPAQGQNPDSAKLKELMGEMHRSGLKPTMFAVGGRPVPAPPTQFSVNFYNEEILSLAKTKQ